MTHNVLLTGASGYLGGSLLAAWHSANLTGFNTLYALVRTDAQAEAVKKYGAVPLKFNAYDRAEVQEAVSQHSITIVFGLIDAMKNESQMHFINALAEVQKSSGIQTHFVHTSGAKVFSEWAGHLTEESLVDNDPNLFNIQKQAKATNPFIQQALDTNCSIIETGLDLNVRSYIFVPCIVYGKSEGFGNPISIQSVDIIRAALSAGRVYKITDGRPQWPVCHISDNTALYLALGRAILNGQDPDSGKNGYYLAASGHVIWDDLYERYAQILKLRGRIEDDTVTAVDDAGLDAMARGLGCPKDLVGIFLAGKCSFTAQHGYSLGWKPEHGPKHVLEEAEEEVDRILENYKPQ